MRYYQSFSLRDC